MKKFEPKNRFALLKEGLAEAVLTNADLFIAGRVDRKSKSVILYTGSFKRFCVPFDWFTPSGTTSPDFDLIEIIDHGLTVKLGNYEAASDVIIEAFGKMI